jgi:lycopene cyclase domain-containing protein
LANFLVAFALSIIPFSLVNGALTALPIVWYNNAETVGIRLGSIPFEDLWYGMLLIMTNVTIFELLRLKIFTYNHQTLHQ